MRYSGGNVNQELEMAGMQGSNEVLSSLAIVENVYVKVSAYDESFFS